MDDTDYQALTEKISELTIRNKYLEKNNRNMVKTIRHLKRVIRSYKQKLELKEKQSNKQHFRNNRKKGSYGRNG